MAKATTTKAGRAAGKASEAMPTDALKDAGQQLLGLLVQRAAQAATERVGGLTDRLDDVTENGGQGLGALLGGKHDGDDEDEQDGGARGIGSTLKSGVGSLKEKVKGALGGGTGGQGKKLKITNIVESIDVGLPLRTTYDLWTQFGEFPSFMKKVENVEQSSEVRTNWKAQVFLSHRTWEATIVEQVPDSHIVWRAKGAKGHVDGGVSFTELGPNLTRVLLVLEYWPQGLFERTGNLWRAQGRRARLEFKHFRRHAMARMLLHRDEVEGWRGEIRDSEVVKTHEEALEEEQRSPEETVDEHPDEPDESASDETEAADETGQDEDDDRLGPADDEDEVDEDEDEDEDEEDHYEDQDEDQGEDDERASGNGRRRRRPVTAARSRGRR